MLLEVVVVVAAVAAVAAGVVVLVELPAVPLVADAALLRLVAAHLLRRSRKYGILISETMGMGLVINPVPFVFGKNCEI